VSSVWEDMSSVQEDTSSVREDMSSVREDMSSVQEDTTSVREDTWVLVILKLQKHLESHASSQMSKIIKHRYITPQRLLDDGGHLAPPNDVLDLTSHVRSG